MNNIEKTKNYFRFLGLYNIVEIVFLCSIIITPSLVTFVGSVSPILKYVAPIISIYFPFFYLLIYNLKKKKIVFIQLVFLFLIVFLYVLIMYFVNYYYEIYHDKTNGIFAKIINGYSSIFVLLFFIFNYKENNLKKFLFISSFLMIVLSVASLLGNGLNKNGYDMNFGYKVTYSIISLLFLLFESKRAIEKCMFGFLAAISVVLLLLFGSRGAIFCPIVFIIIYYNINLKYRLIQKKRIAIFIITLVILAIYFLICIIVSATNISLPLPRNIQTLFQPFSLLSSDSSISRIRIYEKIITLIKDTPFAGFGPLSDQHFLGFDTFSHNILLESCLTFGVFTGSVLVAIYIVFVVLVLKQFKKQQFYVLMFLLFFSLSLPRLLVSYTFWYEINFWISIAIGTRVLIFGLNYNNVQNFEVLDI